MIDSNFKLYTYGHNLDLTMLKVFVDNKVKVTKMLRFVYDRVKHMVGIGEYILVACKFSFSHNVFEKATSGS